MKKLSLRATAFLLSALIALGPTASASWAMGTKTHHSTTHLAEGVDFTRQYLWSATYSDLRTEHYLEYTPNELVQPEAAYGAYVVSKDTLPILAAGLEAEGKRVIGGINGDFFVVATGAPLGMVVTDGVLRSSSSYHYALGFYEDGTALIGKPELSITATFHDRTLAVGGLNKVRSKTGGYMLYTDDYSATTLHTEPGIDVILTPGTTDSVPVIGGQLSCTVEQVLQSTGAIPIPEGKLILSIHSDANQWLVSQLSSLQPGDTVNIDITCADTRWEKAVTAIGGLYKMVTDGVVESGLEDTQEPRTAVGVRPDGSAVFYTVDGRQNGYSVGASIEQVAKRLVELGCVEAICLDGGGSTTLGATLPGEDHFSVTNSPSSGVSRSVSNALFLVAAQAEPGPARQLSVVPGDALMLSGSRLELSAVGTDALGQVVSGYTTDQLVWTLPEGVGTVSDGILTAGSQAGTYTITAHADGLTGSACITVVPTPDHIVLQDEAAKLDLATIRLEPEETLHLSAGALYRNLPVLCRDEDFTWSVSEGLGTIDQSGTFIARDTAGTGTITVAIGELSVSVPVTVAGNVRTAEDFEGDFLTMAGSHNAQIEPETGSAYVRFGKQSAKLSYDTTGGEDAAFTISLALDKSSKYISLWVRGDGSGNTLAAPVLLSDGTYTDVILAVLNFTGWQQITTPLPAGAAHILSMKIIPTGTAAAGTIWLDQVTVSNQFLTDNTPPILDAERMGTRLLAVIQDNMDETFSSPQISVTYDGRELPFVLDGRFLVATLPEEDSFTHRVTVTATDASGNIGHTSLDLLPCEERQPPFADAADHWSADYVSYLYDQGITTGVVTEEGLLFYPNSDITRGEFAVMLARWLRLDLTQYSHVELPFADADTIPGWMLGAIQAMYDMGVMQGSYNNGSTYAMAQTGITRAEAMTMLGRIQSKGYARAELDFADAADIPSWAEEYLSTLVAQKVVSGYGGLIYPNSTIKRCEMAKILYALR